MPRLVRGVLKPMAPKVTARLGAAAFPMTSVSPRCVFFARVLLVCPHGPSSTSSQPTVRWSHVTLVRLVVTHWHFARGTWVAFDDESGAQMEAFRAGLKKACSCAPRDKAPHQESGMKTVCEAAASGPSPPRQAVLLVDLDDEKNGSGHLSESAALLRPGASTAAGFFAVRRASGISQLVTRDVAVGQNTVKR